MGNNNSTSSGHLPPHPQWTPPQPHSLDVDHPRSRMTKGYMSPRNYAGQRVSPQKVLPSVNAAKAAQKLKPTSNGFNLKKCGTISAGRKFNDLEMESPFGVCKDEEFDGGGEPAQRRKENNTGVFGLCRQSGMSSPNLMEDNYRRDEDSLLSSLTTRDQLKAFHESEPEFLHHRLPPPHRGTFENNVPISTSLIQESPAKKQIRSKKKKSAPVPPPPLTKSKNLFHMKPPPPPLLAQEITKVHQRMFKTKAEGRLSSSSEGNEQFLKKSSSQRTDSRNSSQLKESSQETQSSPIKKSTSDVHNLKFERYAPPHGNAAQYELGPPLIKNLKPISRTSSQTQKNIEKIPPPKNIIPYACTHEKEFNLGEKIKTDMNYLPRKNQLAHKDSLNQHRHKDEEMSGKKCFYFGMEIGGSLGLKNSSFPPPHLRAQKIENLLISAPPQERMTAESPTTSSQGFTYNFKQESLSDNMSSSSEMDIVLRPTLPPKRQELPKFSPSAAWNRIELDSPNSSEEEVFGFHFRKESTRARVHDRTKPNPSERVGEGDSGISGLDENGGGSPEILPPPLLNTTTPLSNTKGKCWTPEQDLDDSSSEFEAEEEDEVGHNSKNETNYKSSQRPRLTTRRNFFSSSKSDTEGGKEEPIYAHSRKTKNETLSLSPIDATAIPSEKPSFEIFNPSLTRIINHRRSQEKERGLGLDANWFLSRSEPNSLNLMDLMVGGEARDGSGDDEAEDGIRSDNGYAPTPLHSEMGSNGNCHSLDWKKSNSLISLSHIVYLPQLRSAHDDAATKRNRKIKSVENLLKQSESQAVGSETKHGPTELQAQMNNNKRKKFKFQSTLKVLERKQIEKELTREAEEKEMERLREIEAMKRVEAEFQKKRRSKETLAVEKEKLNENGVGPLRRLKSEEESVIVSLSQWEERRGCVDAVDGRSRPALESRHSSGRRSELSRPAPVATVLLTQRQDPEGAPSIQDLRKELIQEARKRGGNGQGISSTSSDLTQELSEYRQETRQYCDYRRSPRVNKDGSAPTRFTESSSSDIFPLRGRTPAMDKQKRRQRSTVVHPEIVCDIPNRPFPFMVNFSRLSGSHTSLHIDERPTSGIGYTSGPSSVISDNYRRDWAHHHSKPSGSPLGHLGKSSSITSLHSTSDNCRHQEVNGISATESPMIFHRVFRPKSPGRMHQSSPAPISPPLTSSSTSHRITTSIESSVHDMGRPSTQKEACLQPQPYTNYKSKSYRPVIFNPKNRPQ